MGGLFTKNSSRSDKSTKNGKSKSQDCSNGCRTLATPFVFKKWSSMYIDEDGDVAHEFYVEHRKARSSNEKQTLYKVDPSHLRQEGYIDYEIPRLHPAIPYIMVELT